MSDELDGIKRDESALWRAYADLGGKRSKNDPMHNHCPLCNDASGFMIGTGGNGIAGWRCYAGKSASCAHNSEHKLTGSIIDLLMRARSISDKEACKLALERYGNGRKAEGGMQKAETTQTSAPAPKRKEGKKYPSAMEAIAALEWGMSKQKAVLAHVWKYLDAKGEPAIEVARFNFPDGRKEFRPLHRDGQGWRIGLGDYGKGKLCPLYGLPGILKARELTNESGNIQR